MITAKSLVYVAGLAAIALPLGVVDRDVARSFVAGCRNTLNAGNIVLTVPSALMCLFAYSHHAEHRHNFQAFPPISPVCVAAPD